MMVVDYAALPQLLLWGSLNSQLRLVTRKRLCSHFTRMLSPYFGDDLAPFLLTLRQSRSVVSGSVALAMLLLGESDAQWISQDMDIYTPVDAADAVVLTLMDEYGFCICEAQSTTNSELESDNDFSVWEELELNEETTLGEGYRSRFIQSTIKLHKGSVTVDVVTSVSRCALLPILSFHCTHVMNFVTSSGIVSFYPSLTSSGKGIINPGVLIDGIPTSRTRSAIEKYRQRGFDIRGDDDEEVQQARKGDPCSLATPRCSRDALSMALTFDDRIASNNRERVYPSDHEIRWELGKLAVAVEPSE